MSKIGYKHPNWKGGISYNAKKYWDEYYKQNKSKIIKYQKSYITINGPKYRKIVFDYYGNGCVCCKEKELSFLTIDHISNDRGKDIYKNGKRITGIFLYKKIIKNNFPNIYQILCWNCNWGKYKNNGICPHQS